VPELVREPNVASLRIFPGITEAMLGRMLDAPVDAIVLETYGAGNFPARRKELVAVIRGAVDRGVVVVNCSQCHTGRVSQDVYETGRSLADVGAVSGADMTPEAALTKLYCLLAEGYPSDEVRRLTGRPLVGELTP
jgi:L-asparaginase/Glu-tRNA(Gln) amidotransferase subunit D